MDALPFFTLLLFLLVAGASLLVLASLAWKKSKTRAGLQIQCSSGDSEVMSFNYNFMEGESDFERDQKIQEAFDLIQRRRDENHAKWLAVKAQALEEKAKAQNEETEDDLGGLGREEPPQRMVQ